MLIFLSVDPDLIADLSTSINQQGVWQIYNKMN